MNNCLLLVPVFPGNDGSAGFRTNYTQFMFKSRTHKHQIQ